MTEQIEKKHLSKTIDYDRDIAPYRFIKIYAGVGSGKNRFIDRLVQGNYFKHADGTYVEKQYILLITSRRSKVNEQLNLDNVTYDPAIGEFDNNDSWLIFDPKYSNYYESPMMELEDLDGWGSPLIYRRSCVNTNAKIEANLRKSYKDQNIASHPWERFDMIIVDEVHSLLSDASFQSAPFYVRRLIEETLKRSSKCKVIVMTGTPEVLDLYPLFEEAHLIDRMEECISVRPQTIEFITKKEAESKQHDMLMKGQKFVAFFNHIKDVLSLGKEYPDATAVSFSDRKERDELKKSNINIYKKMVATEDYIAQNKHLPDDITAFLCTAKHKEGINIKNDDVSVLFIESHSKEVILQMAGRIRNPVDKLYLVFDSRPHTDLESPLEAELSKREDMLASINSYFQEKCKEYDFPLFDKEASGKPVHCLEKTGAVIDYIHAKFPHIRFDYFTSMFVYYPEKAISKAYHKEQQKIFSTAAETESGLIELAQQWYPGIECSVSKKLQQRMYAENKSKVDQYLTENRWLNGERIIRQNERQEIQAALVQLLGITNQDTKLASLLKQYKYKLEAETKSKNANAPSRITTK